MFIYGRATNCPSSPHPKENAEGGSEGTLVHTGRNLWSKQAFLPQRLQELQRRRMLRQPLLTAGARVGLRYVQN